MKARTTRLGDRGEWGDDGHEKQSKVGRANGSRILSGKNVVAGFSWRSGG